MRDHRGECHDLLQLPIALITRLASLRRTAFGGVHNHCARDGEKATNIASASGER